MGNSQNYSGKGALGRYFSIMIARTIGFVLVIGFIFAVIVGATPMAKNFLEGKLPSASKSGNYQKDTEKVDPVKEAIVKIQGDYAVGNTNDYITNGGGSDVPSSIAAGNILKLTQEKGITSFAQLKALSDSVNGTEVANALGKNVWVKKADGNDVILIGTVNGVQCTLDLANHQAKECSIP